MDIQNDIRVTRFLREFNNRLVNESHSLSDVGRKKTLKKLGKFYFNEIHKYINVLACLLNQGN